MEIANSLAMITSIINSFEKDLLPQFKKNEQNSSFDDTARIFIYRAQVFEPGINSNVPSIQYGVS